MNILKKLKIKRELKKFKEFKKNYNFKFKQLVENNDGTICCDGVCIKDINGEIVNVENDLFVNVGYANKGSSLAKALSNLFPYKFYFRGFCVESVEGVIQGLKIKDKHSQKFAFSYTGLNANRIKACSDYDWQKNQIIYFQGKPIKRDSEEYNDFIDELYVSLLQNQLFVNALKMAKDKYILHSIGNEDKTQTLLTRYEFEFMLNCLKDYVVFAK